MLADRVALMFDGVVQQVGEPNSFYKRPATTRVARFFRNSNFLNGKRSENVVATSVGDIEIDPALVPDGSGPVVLTVRPEEIEPVVGGSSGTNVVPATIESVIYMGSYTQVEARIGDQIWIVQTSATFMPREGDTVGLRLPREHVWIVKDDSTEEGAVAS